MKVTRDVGEREQAFETGGQVSDQSVAIELLEPFLALMPDAAVVVRDDGTIASVNERAEALFGYEPSELCGRHVEVLVPERSRHEHRRHRTEYTAAPRAREMGAGLELSGRRRDGSEFPVDISLAPLAGHDQQLVVVSIRDASERRAATATAAQLAAIVRSSADGIISTSPEGIVTSWNPGAERLFGYTPAEIVGAHVSTLVPDDASEDLEELLAAALAGRPSVPRDTTWLTNDGVRLEVAFSVSLLHGTAGQTLGFALLVRDVTERKQAEAELRRALVERERRERQQAATSETRLALLSQAPIDEVLQLTCAHACELLRAQNAVVALQEDGELRIAAATHAHLVGVVLAMDASLSGLAVTTRRPQRFASLGRETLFALGPIQPVPEGPALAVPIVSGEVVHGALSLARELGAPLIDDDDAHVLQGIADQLALGLELVRARDLRDRLLLIDDRERIAHHLHDDVIQQLFGVSLRLQNVAGLTGDRRVADQVSEMIDDLDATIRRIRAAVFELETRNRTT